MPSSCVVIVRVLLQRSTLPRVYSFNPVNLISTVRCLSTKHKAMRWQAPELARCSGCGSTFQTENPRAPGYVPPEKRRQLTAKISTFEETSVVAKGEPKKKEASSDEEPESRPLPSELVCQRCYRIEHYGEVLALDIEPETFRQQIGKALQERSALVLLVVDLLDYPGSLLSDIERIIGTHHDVILVGNKLDLLPTDASRPRMTMWLSRHTKNMWYRVHPRVVLCSAQTGEGVDNLLKIIESKQGDRNIFVVGCTNVGKSELVNALTYKMGIRGGVTTSPLPGTTINIVRFPQSKGRFLIDTPGIISPEQLTPKLSPAELKLVVPSNKLQPKTFVLSENRSLLLGGIGRLDVINTNGARVLATVFASMKLPLHLTNIERANELLATRRGYGILQPPCLPKKNNDDNGESGIVPTDRLPLSTTPQQVIVSGVSTQTRSKASLPIPSRTDKSSLDIVFPSVGWIAMTVPANYSVELNAYAPQGLSVSTRDALLPYEVTKRGKRERKGGRSRFF